MSDSEEEVHDKQLKIILVGDCSAGKTSVSSRYSQDQFTKQYCPTVGVDFFLKRLVFPDNLHVALQVWDVGGQSIGGKMIDKYLYGSHGVMLVYDITSITSFECLEDWLAVIRRVFEPNGKLPHMALVGNKSDMEHMRTVKADRHHKLVQEHSMSSHFVSAKTGDAVTLCFRKLAADILGVRLSRPDIEVQQTVVKADIAAYHGEPNSLRPVPQTQVQSSTCNII